MESSTKILRRLLDERGVEYETDDTQVSDAEWYYVTKLRDGYHDRWIYEEPPDCDLLVSYQYDLGAEDAIAATLGSCNCPNNCTDGERAETCHDEGTFNSWGLFTCSNCSIVFPLDAVKDAPSIGRTLPPKYCPNCGARVVEPTTNDVDAEVAQ